jgi:RNA polymerase sigma factor (TIGR02999 family)
LSDVTHILDRAQQGDPQAADELLPLVYDELRRLAQSRMSQDASGQTLQATALVHEAWLRLGAGATQRWEGRKHFFAAAAQAMRQILIERGWLR